MTRMSSNPSSRLLIVITALVLFAGAAGAVSIANEDTPSEVKVGDRITATYVFVDLYKDPQYTEWTLQGVTELDSVTWTAQLVDQAGNVREQNSYDGTIFNQSVSVENDVDEVRVQLTGNAPEIANWSYEDQQPIMFVEFRLTRQGGTSTVIDRYSATRFTEDSARAREAIEAADAAIAGAGGNAQAETTLDNAISAYNVGNFDNAVDLANQARNTAQSAQQQSQTFQLALYVIVGIVVLVAVVGGIFWYRSQQGASKL